MGGSGVFDDDEDFLDSDDDDDDADLEDEPARAESGIRPTTVSHKRQGGPSQKRGRTVRVRRMSKRMMEKKPDFASILITKLDGKQCLFVRGK